MSFKDYIHSGNNQKIMVDNDFNKEKETDLYSLLSNERPNIDQCGTVYLKNNRKHFGVCGIGDLHTDEMVYSRWNAVKEYCHNTNLALFYLGDLITASINNYSNAQPQESKFNVQDEMFLTKKEVAYNAHKTLGSVGGNHDEPQQGDRLKDVYMSAAREIMEVNKIPYSPNAMLYIIDMPVYNKNRKFLYHKPVYILTLHGHGKTPSERIASANKLYEQGMGVMKQYNKLHGTSIVPDFIFGGHFHGNSNCDYNVECNITNKLGRVTGSYSKTVRVRECSTFASKQSSSFNNSFSDSINQNLNVVDFIYIHNDKFNPMQNNDEAEDVLDVVEFPILRRNSNDYTVLAQIYNSHNKDYDLYEKEKQKHKNSSLDEMVKEL